MREFAIGSGAAAVPKVITYLSTARGAACSTRFSFCFGLGLRPGCCFRNYLGAMGVGARGSFGAFAGLVRKARHFGLFGCSLRD
jgi:hypothetical protein